MWCWTLIKASQWNATSQAYKFLESVNMEYVHLGISSFYVCLRIIIADWHFHQQTKTLMRGISVTVQWTQWTASFGFILLVQPSQFELEHRDTSNNYTGAITKSVQSLDVRYQGQPLQYLLRGQNNSMLARAVDLRTSNMCLQQAISVSVLYCC